MSGKKAAKIKLICIMIPYMLLNPAKAMVLIKDSSLTSVELIKHGPAPSMEFKKHGLASSVFIKDGLAIIKYLHSKT